MKTKEQLKREIEKIEERENAKAEKEKLQRNYEKFKERDTDLIIGKAHADIGITKIDYDWYKDRFFTIGDAISIHGNCGTSYKAQAPITSATHTFFHNVWSDNQRRQFQDRLNKVAIKEVMKIMSDLRCVLEIMGLQSESFFTSYIYPKNKKTEIMVEIEAERKKILDKYTDKQFKELKNLSHGNGILKSYLKKYRPHLLKEND